MVTKKNKNKKKSYVSATMFNE